MLHTLVFISFGFVVMSDAQIKKPHPLLNKAFIVSRMLLALYEVLFYEYHPLHICECLGSQTIDVYPTWLP